MRQKIISIISSLIMLAGLFNVPAAAAEAAGIASISVIDGAKDIQPIGYKIEVKFSENMDMNTVNKSTVTLYPGGIASIVPAGANKAVIYFDMLKIGTEYELKFLKAIKTAAGENIRESSYKFTTTYQMPKYRQMLNGDMEDENLWNVYSDAGANSTVFIKEGDNTVLRYKLGWNGARVTHRAYFEPGKTYEVRAKVKVSKRQDVWVNYMYATQDRPNETYHKGKVIYCDPDEWYEYTDTYTVPSEPLLSTFFPGIEMYAREAGTYLYIDDWELYEQGCDVPAPVMELSGGNMVEKVTRIEDANSGNPRAEMLKGIGIYGEKEFAKGEDLPTKEKFSTYLARLMGMENIKMTDLAREYNDINPSIYEGFAGLMRFYDLIRPDNNGNFGAYDNITYKDACRALCIAMGYKAQSEEKGVMNCALALGLSKGITLNEDRYIDYNSLTILLYNALEADVIIQDSDGDFTISRSGGMVKNAMKLTEKKGIVDKTSKSGLYGEDTVADDEISIDGMIYTVNKADVSDLLGKKVRFFVKEDGSEQTVIYICDVNKYNNIVTLDAASVSGYDGNIYTYWNDNNAEKTEKLESDKCLIYNGRVTGSYTAADMCPADGSVELIDNDNNGKYDVVKIISYETFTVKSIDYEKGVIYDKYENKSVKINTKGDLTVFSQQSTISFDSINENDVLTVALSMDGDMAVIYRSNDVYTGQVCEVSRELNGRGDSITRLVMYDDVHGSEVKRVFESVPGYKGTDGIVSGTYQTVYFDAFGRAAALCKNMNGWYTGYLLGVNYDSGTDEANIKLYVQENDVTVFTISSGIVVDNSRIKNMKALKDILKPYELSLVRCKMNNGLLTGIETLGNSAENGLRLIASGSGEYRAPGQTIGNIVGIDSNTEVLCRYTTSAYSDSSGSTDYKFLHTRATDYLLNNKIYTFKAYSVSDDILTADIILFESRAVKNPNNVLFGTVESVKRVLDENGEIIQVVSCVNANGKLSLKVNDDVDLNNLKGYDNSTGLSLSDGDTIKWNLTNEGYAIDITILFKFDDKKLLSASNPNTDNFNTSVRLFYGSIDRKEGSVVRINNGQGTSEVYNLSEMKNLYKCSSDNSKFMIEKISSADISEYFNNDVLAIITWNDPIVFMVY